MKNYITKYFCIAAALLAVAGAQAQTADNYKKPTPVQLNRDLPRTRTICYNSEEGALAGNSRAASLYFQPLSEGWSRSERDGGKTAVFSRQYKVPFQWVDRQYFIRVGSVNGAYDMIINGKFAGYNQNGGTPAEFDVTALSQEGINTVELVVYGDHAAKKLENHTSDTRPAITGEVYIVSQPRIRIRDFTTRTNIEGKNATVELGVIMKSHLLNTKNVRIYYSLLSPTGEQVSYGHRDAEFKMKGEDTVRFFINVRDAMFWSHEMPNLYTLQLKTQHEGRYSEYVSYNIGIRTAEVNDGKLLINSHEMPLSVAVFTSPADSASTEAALTRLKSGGVNTIKVESFPQPEYFYDMCDRIGLYVCDQANVDTRAGGASRKKGGNPSNDPAWADAFVDRAMTMYHTSQNHPSVVMFSLAENAANGYNLYESYLALKKAENARPVIYLGAGGEWNSDAVSGSTRSEKPAAAASRMVFDTKPMQNVSGETAPDIIVANANAGIFHVINYYYAAPLHGVQIEYTVKQGSRKVASGTRTLDIAPRSSTEMEISYDKAKIGKNLLIEFTIIQPQLQSTAAGQSGTAEVSSAISSWFKKDSAPSSPAVLARRVVSVPY